MIVKTLYIKTCGIGKNKTCSVQFSSVAQSCLTLCDSMNHSIPGLPVHLRRAETKRKKEFNHEAWEKETSNTIS